MKDNNKKDYPAEVTIIGFCLLPFIVLLLVAIASAFTGVTFLGDTKCYGLAAFVIMIMAGVTILCWLFVICLIVIVVCGYRLIRAHRNEKKTAQKSYDAGSQQPVIRSSICTGEMVAGFQDKQTGKFTEVMLIRSESDLEQFKNSYGITEEVKKIY